MSDNLTIDDLTVVGIDGIRRTFDEHYDTMMCVEQDPTGAHHAIHNQHARIEELEAQLKPMIDPQVAENMVRVAEPMLSDALAAADKRIEELEAKLEALDHAYDSIVQALRFEALRTDDAEAKLARAMDALDGVMVGGNHLATILPDSFPPAETEPLIALEAMGYGYDYEVWCCWRSIMLARATLAELKGEQP